MSTIRTRTFGALFSPVSRYAGSVLTSAVARWVIVAVMLAEAVGPANAAPTVSATSTPGASALDLDGEGSSQSHIVKVADVSAHTLWLLGFTVSISTGNLTNTDGATPVAFQVALVDDGASPPTLVDFTIPSGGTLIWVTNLAGGAAKDLYILYTPADLQDPGAYTAAISISIVNN